MSPTFLDFNKIIELLQEPQLIYALTGSLFLLMIVIWSNRYLKKLENQRLEFVDNLDSNPIMSGRRKIFFLYPDNVQKGIENRFSIFRKLTNLSFGLCIFLIILLPFLGQMPSTLISILMAAFTVIIGIAAKPIVENMIAGIVITVSKHLAVGDTITIDEHYGTIEDISLTHTSIKLWDWRRYIISNSQLLNKPFLHYSNPSEFLWAYITLWISYTEDLDTLEKAFIQLAKKNNYYYVEEEPQLWVMEMHKEGYLCWFAAWVKTPVNAWNWKVAVRTEIAKYFQSHKIKAHIHHIDQSNPNN